MKNVYYNLRADAPPQHIKNRLNRLTQNEDFWKLFFSLRDEVYKDKKSFDNPTRKCIKAIKKFLQKNNSPLTWIIPVYSHMKWILMKKDIFTYPYDDNITLRVGKHDLIVNGEITLDQDKKGRLQNEENSISIVITGKTSIEHLSVFIKQYKSDLIKWQKIINLPQYKKLTWRVSDLAYDIIRMKDRDGLSFGEIVNKLQQEMYKDEDTKDKIMDENSIKSLYYEYKKFFSVMKFEDIAKLEISP